MGWSVANVCLGTQVRCGVLLYRRQEECVQRCPEADAHLVSATGADTSPEEISTGNPP